MNNKSRRKIPFNGISKFGVVVGGSAVRLCHRRRVTGITGSAYCTIAV